MNFDVYLDQIPKLHTWDKGKTWCTGGFGRQQLKCLHEFLCTHEINSVIETGAGNSTITFLLSSATVVTSIAPDPGLFKKIEEFCSENTVPIEKLRKVVGFSQWELPKIAAEAREKVDFALIDG